MTTKDLTRGPGRPPIPLGEEQKRRNINLDDARAEFAARIGRGNLSKGLRRLIDDAMRTEGHTEARGHLTEGPAVKSVG